MSKRNRDYYPSESKLLKNSETLIKLYFRLDLSLIERVQLKQYVNESLEELDTISRKQFQVMRLNLFEPASEAVARYMHDYYGLPLQVANIYNEGEKENGIYSEELLDLLQRQQYRMHNPFAFKD